MEEERANLKPSLQQSARANAAAEPGHIGGRECPITGHHTYANPWVTTHHQNHAFAPLVDPSPSQSPENIFPAGAAYNAGIAFPNGLGHYSWAPAVAARPMDQYADTNFRHLDPSLSLKGQIAIGFTGNGHGGQYAANGFNTHTSAAGAFPNASFAVGNGNSYGCQSSACGFDTQLVAPGANSSALRAIDSGNVYEGQLPASGLGTPLMAPDTYPSAFRAIDSSNVYGGQLPANGFDTPLMVPDAYPSAFRTINRANVYGGQFPASGFQNQPSAALELPNAPHAVDDNASPLGPAQVAPARYTCAECNHAFKRKGELKRHAKKHQADSKVFRCVAAGCEYSSYRKDKLDDHVKHHHTTTASAST